MAENSTYTIEQGLKLAQEKKGQGFKLAKEKKKNND